MPQVDVMFFAKLLVYGHLGVLLEVWFTSLHAIVFDKDLRAPGRTYLWMVPIYGLGGLTLGALRTGLHSWWLFMPAAVAAIYATEFLSGLVLRKLVGRCPWDYGQARFGVMGLVRLDYLPFWALVAAAYDLLADYLGAVLELAGMMA